MIPHPSLAPLLFGGTLPPSQIDPERRPLPPLAAAVASASVAADGLALVAVAEEGLGLWQCQYDRPGDEIKAAAWSRVEVEGLPRGERFSAVAAGDLACLALSAVDGSVFMWSRRRGGEEDDDDKDDTPTIMTAKCVLGPRLPDEDGDESTTSPLHRLPIAAIAAGRRHFVAVARPPSAAAFAWGDNSRGQCSVAAPGGGSFVPHPRLIEALGGIACSTCAAGDAHSLVGSADGASVFEFGGGGGGGDRPALVPDIDHLPGAVVALAAGGRHSVALDAEGRVQCWGGEEGDWGQRRVGVADERARVGAVVAGWRHTVLVME